MTTIEHKNSVYAYYFYRLIQRAENITLLYNTASDGLNRGEMSRFMLQFLVESIMLACFGGLLGVILAFGASVLLTHFMGVPFIFSPGINVLAFCFAAFIGIIFGYFPARRAAQLDPIEAVRHE